MNRGHRQPEEIPQWFIDLRQKVYNQLNEYVGVTLNQRICKEIEEKVNEIISSAPCQITTDGQVPVNYITINMMGGAFSHRAHITLH